MSQGAIQTLITTIAGLLMAAAIYMLTRRGRTSFRFTVGLLGLCLLGITAGISISIVELLSETLKVSPAALLGIGANFCA